MDVVVGALQGKDGWLVARRAHGDRAFPGCWEFPGGKIDPGESPLQALAREWQEEMGLDIRIDPMPVETLHFTKADGFPYDARLRLYRIKDMRFDTDLNVWPEHMPEHSCVLYLSLDRILRMDPRDVTPSMHPFARRLQGA